MKKFAIVAAALAVVSMVAAPAMAEVTPYMSMRMATVINDTDQDTDFQMGLQANSRFGARFTTDDLRGGVEMSMAGPVALRLLWGSYQFGEAGTLLVGQHYTPYHLLSDEAMYADGGNVGYGALYDGRNPQIKFTLPMGLYVAAISPKSTSWSDRYGSDLNDEFGKDKWKTDVDTMFPKIAVGYNMTLDAVKVGVHAAFNQVSEKLKSPDSAKIDEDITSYLVSAQAKFAAGPAAVMGNLYFGQNLGNFGVAGLPASAQAAVKEDANGKLSIEDTTNLGGYVQASFDAGMANVAAGLGYTQSDNSEYKKANGSSADPDGQMSYWLQATIPIAKTFFIVPGVSYYDKMDNAAGKEEKDAWQAGVKWQMNL